MRRLALFLALALAALAAGWSSQALSARPAAPTASGSRPGAAPTATAARAKPAAKGAHTIFFLNTTPETVWLAAWPGSIEGRTGWKLRPATGGSFEVRAGWRAKVWGRTGCHFHGGRGSCRSGGCEGRFQCRGRGAIPATLAEFDLDSLAGLDFYDVSMVDGSNLPMYVRVIHGEANESIDANGCLRPGVCTSEVRCPQALRVPRGSRHPIACASPCSRFGTDRYCCRGRFAARCSPARTWPVDYAKVFKRAEPFAFSWSGDAATSVFTCKGSCDYEVVFGVTPPGVGGPPG